MANKLPVDKFRRQILPPRLNSSWSLLECEVCKKLLKPRIYLCDNGHSVCNDCKNGKKNCNCGAEILDKFKETIEALARSAHYPCCNAEFGCKILLKLDKLSSHQRMCEYKGFNCFFRINEGCTWKGSRKDIRKHMENEHADWVPSNSSRKPMKGPSGGNFKILLSAYNTSFWYDSKRDPVTKDLLHAVKCLAPITAGVKFYFQFVITEENNVVVYSKLYSIFYEDDIEYVLNNRQCLIIPKQIVEAFSESNMFKYKIIILKNVDSD